MPVAGPLWGPAWYGIHVLILSPFEFTSIDKLPHLWFWLCNPAIFVSWWIYAKRYYLLSLVSMLLAFFPSVYLVAQNLMDVYGYTTFDGIGVWFWVGSQLFVIVGCLKVLLLNQRNIPRQT